jgi:hypothetical protein
MECYTHAPQIALWTHTCDRADGGDDIVHLEKQMQVGKVIYIYLMSSKYVWLVCKDDWLGGCNTWICAGYPGPEKMIIKNNFGHLPAAKLNISM